MTKSGKYILFWGGTFSQWAASDFTLNGVVYTSCEQYMMAKKAIHFDDYDSYANIMRTNNPKTQKAIGRKVKNFDSNKWNEVCRKVVFDANYAKFTQNKEMLDELLDTGELIIVEASPEDRIWGIGLHESDPRAWDESTWEGTNWLGEALMEVREKIRLEK